MAGGLILEGNWMDYDLIAIDIDGTLIRGNAGVSAPVFEAIQRVVKAGKRIVLCTGRPFPGARRYMEELRLTQEGDFLITYHGALVQRTDTLETVIHHELSMADLQLWHEFVQDVGVNFQAVRNDGVYMDAVDVEPQALIEPFFNELPLRLRDFDQLNSTLNFSKFIMADQFELIEKLEEQIPRSFREKFTVVRSVENAIEVLNKDASKGQSLSELAEYLEIPRERVMAIGDSGNDIDMVEYAGLGVAMGNAIPAVKDVADIITDSVDEDGVATAINRYFFD